MRNDLILVDAQNRAVGRADKRQVHEAGLLHRAFSIFLVDAAGRLLLQQRHPAKYHSGSLWANSCCGHPRPGETTLRAAQRRLGEELGATSPLRFGFRTRYGAVFPNGLVENEIVYVYFGFVPARVTPNGREISAMTLTSVGRLKSEIKKNPAAYSFWLKHYMAHHAREIGTGIDSVLRHAREGKNKHARNPMASRTRASPSPPRRRKRPAGRRV